MKYHIEDYVIAIPSYKRVDILRDKTLRYLQMCKIDPKKIFIFVADKNEKYEYIQNLPKYYNKIVVGERGIRNIRWIIRNYFGEGEYLISIDDDIDYLINKGVKKGVPLLNLNSFIISSFQTAIDNQCRMWGIGSHSNPFFLRDGYTIGLRYIISTFYGLKNTHDKNTYIEIGEKEGASRSILFYLADGRVMKINSVCMKTSFFGNAGGLQDVSGKNRINTKIKEAGEWLIKKYPQFVYFKKNSKRYDLALRMLKPVASKNHKWW